MIIRASSRPAAVLGILLIASIAGITESGAGTAPHLLTAAMESDAVSPALRIRREHSDTARNQRRGYSIRSIDGSGNNRQTPAMGAANTPLRRRLAADYADGVSQMAGADRPSARALSNIISAHSQHSLPNEVSASDFLWQWGQFLDHDIDLTDGTSPPEPAGIAVPAGDLHFDPDWSGDDYIAFNRSLYAIDTGTGSENPRQQINEITAWIDASNVYGSDETRAQALRTNDGTGRLKTSDNDLLPFNVDGLPNAGGDSPALFLAGDVRANEQVGLTALHTLFVREHNRLAGIIARHKRHLDGDQIYEHARRIVGAQMQAITYNEYLPMLLGADALAPYRGYRQDVDAMISNVFSGALYRYGHSALSPALARLDKHGKEIRHGHLRLRDAFFAPHHITDEGGIEPLLRGLANQMCEEVDVYVVDDVRNFLFGEPGAGGFDLVALNIQRGRDHGLPGYNDARIGFGLQPAQTFADISSDPHIQARLASAYATVDDIDVWVGSLAEDHLPGAMVGKLMYISLKEQFEALRDGDRFWYERSLGRDDLRVVRRSSLADIIRRNTNIKREIGDNVFRVPEKRHKPRRRRDN